MRPLSHLASYLESTAERVPERTAVVESGGRSVTYAELDHASDRVAAYLSSQGLTTGSRVGLAMPKSVEAVAAIFGVLKSGAAYVPVDPHGPVVRSAAILADCGVEALCLHDDVRGILDEWSGAARPSVVLGFPGAESSRAVTPWAEALSAGAPVADGASREVSDLAYILYTSGSTGIPKGVPVSHANASSFVEWGSATFEPTEHDRFSSHAPFHFDLSIFDLFVAVKHGASVHLIDDALSRNPRALAQHAAESDLTVWYSTPSALTLLAQHGRMERLEYKGPRLVLFAGEVFPVKHLKRATELWSNARFFNLYGPTETNVCTFTEIPLPIPDDRVDPYPIGQVCDHCEALVIGTDGEAVGNGQMGVLYVAGEPVFDGYWMRPEINARVFMERDGARYYETGDVVEMSSDGTLLFRGRKDRMVKRRGYRIELGEIEKAVYAHPGIEEVAAIALEESGGVQIVVCYTATEPYPSIVQLKQFTATRIPHYMVPDTFRRLDDMPLTSTGKTDYQTLKRELLEA